MFFVNKRLEEEYYWYVKRYKLKYILQKIIDISLATDMSALVQSKVYFEALASFALPSFVVFVVIDDNVAS